MLRAEAPVYGWRRPYAGSVRPPSFSSLANSIFPPPVASLSHYKLSALICLSSPPDICAPRPCSTQKSKSNTGTGAGDGEDANATESDAPTGWENGQLCLSRVHGGVCWIPVGASRMCGMVFDVSTSLYRHMRQEHRISLRPNSRSNILISETVEGEQALLRYARAQHWRNASDPLG
ncbi:uncharacterized protein LDX57_002653 [Aspergillus melleus]|uniref:uncharacterized protein n=1 Tax=Aspergillus melleus TaxID=138277 RepID=UPI001E8D8857|nr:uncharacterized protein LDX57_002653 [Aspergillus melleus]KAH8424908.1 hypothetical protein LDX57_002653 [Aspergillus melleus]